MKSTKKNNGIFRKEALEQLAIHDLLNELISLTPPKAWIILLTVLLLLVVFICWGIWGSIPSRVYGEGILLTKGGKIFLAVGPNGNNRITEVNVQLGQTVQKGQVIAHLDDTALGNELAITENYLQKLVAKYNLLTSTADSNILSHKQRIAEQDQILRRMINNEQESLQHITELLETQKKAQKKGNSTKQDVLATTRSYYDAKVTIEQYHKQIKQNEINIANFIDQWQERLRNLDLKIKDKEQELASLRDKFDSVHVVTSPINGVVVMIHKSIGEVATEGEPVMSIASQSAGMDALVFFPSDKSTLIQPKMRALVTPKAINKEEYGSIIGAVDTVSAYPATSKSMMAILQNQNLVDQFSKFGAPTAARVSLTSSVNDPNDLVWTSAADHQELAIAPGSLIAVSVTIKRQAPLSLIIPAFKAAVFAQGQ